MASGEDLIRIIDGNKLPVTTVQDVAQAVKDGPGI